MGPGGAARVRVDARDDSPYFGVERQSPSADCDHDTTCTRPTRENSEFTGLDCGDASWAVRVSAIVNSSCSPGAGPVPCIRNTCFFFSSFCTTICPLQPALGAPYGNLSVLVTCSNSCTMFRDRGMEEEMHDCDHDTTRPTCTQRHLWAPMLPLPAAHPCIRAAWARSRR